MTGSPAWTFLDPDVYGPYFSVTGWTIDRGRSYELDKTGVGTASVSIVDWSGYFDPTIGSTADVMYHAAIAMLNPVTGATATLFRGYVSALHYEPYTNEQVANVKLELVDAFAVFAAMELPPAALSGSTVSLVAGNLSFPALAFSDAVQRRIGDGTHYGGILSDIKWPTTLRSIFTGNVKLQATTYPPRTSPLTVMQDAADSEFPGVANLYMSRDGKVTFRGRLARFNPTDPSYGITTWYLGDQAAANASASTVVPISPPITVSRDDSNLYSDALATYNGIADADIAGQHTVSSAATATYGLRTWSAEGLLTAGGTANTAAQETKLFATYYVNNYSTPRTRVGQLTVRPQPPAGTHGPVTWALMCGVDISDRVSLTTTHGGGGGFAGDYFFIEGVHYDANTSGGTAVTNVTLTLDVSPAGYWSSNPF